MLPKAAKQNRMGFASGALVQLSMTWFTFRFALVESRTYSYLGSLGDMMFCALLLAVLLYFVVWSIVPDSKIGYALKIPVLIGTLSFALTCSYPLQMAWFGSEWLDCVSRQYPYQQAAFVLYIYIPFLWSIATIFFGMTLYTRKILSVAGASNMILLLVLPTLLLTVLSQEVHMSEVSTQKLILLCGNREESASLEELGRLLDTSKLAQTVLAYLDIQLRTPPTY